MGAGVSAGENNDDLIDKLIDAKYVKTTSVERILRAVDRGAYFLPNPPANAYRDAAWINGNLHISAPCIYSVVLEALELRPGLSFLNLGSGTGYLNTVAGLALGSGGVNHGIEVHENVIEYAYTKLEEFKRHSGALDEFDFCEPKFVQGNCLNLSDNYPTYDRVYCGAACAELKELRYVKKLVKVGGTLVVPYKDRLIGLTRVNDVCWSTIYLLPVSFTNLRKPEQGSQEFVPSIETEPLTLQELCRSVVRNLLRHNIERDHPTLKNTKNRTAKKKKQSKRERNSRRESRRSTDDPEFLVLTIARNRARGVASFSGLDYAERASTSGYSDSSDGDESSSDEHKDSPQSSYRLSKTTGKSTSDTEIGRAKKSDSEEDDDSASEEEEEMETESTAIVHREDVPEAETNNQRNDERQGNDVCYNITLESTVVRQNESKIAKLEAELQKSFPIDVVEIVSSSSEDSQEKRCKRGLKEKEQKLGSKSRKIHRIDTPKKSSESEDSSDDENPSNSDSEFIDMMIKKKMYISPYSVHMKTRVQELPLPTNLKRFLNHYREF